MGTDSNPKKIAYNGATAQNFGSVFMQGIAINKTLVGTLIVAEGSTAVANFAATTPPNTYHVIPNGVRYGNLNITLSTAADDVTAFTRVA